MSIPYYLKSLGQYTKHNIILKNMQYRELYANKTERAIIKLEYTCPDNTCNFNDIRTYIKNDNILKNKWKMSDACLEIVNDIDKYQSDYLPNNINGFIITRFGQEILYLSRCYKPDISSKDITCIIEINTILK